MNAIARRIASQPLPYPCRRLHGSFLARSGAAIPPIQTNATPYYPQEPRTTSCTPKRRQIAQTTTGRRGAPTFTLASLDLARCLRRPSAQSAVCGRLDQLQHLPPPQSVQIFRTPPV